MGVLSMLDAKGREVLRNLAGIRDADRLEKFERLETTKLGRDLPRVTADADGLRAMHHRLFKTVYAWAGQFRVVNMVKSGSQFIVASRIDTALAFAFRETDLTARLLHFSKPEAAKKLAQAVSDVNFVHPFREGNGRAVRAFVTAIAREAGWRFSLTDRASPHGSSLPSGTPSASESRMRADPGRSGFCWLSCGAQPENQTRSKVARTRPSASQNSSE